MDCFLRGMFKMHENDTIAAISTPIGVGAIGMVRLSGPGSIAVAGAIFKAKNNKPAELLKSHTVSYGTIVNAEEIVDEVLLAVMKAPNTYTGEDIVEINCHGGIMCVRLVLEAALKNGARIAEPGEFTKRAFLNGRMDLYKAEAVIDVINAETTAQHKIAAGQLEGGANNVFRATRDELLALIAQIEAAIDYPEDDIEPLTLKTIRETVEGQIRKLEDLLSTFEQGKIIKEGLKTTILGPPNVGKSSLLNALSGENRAIVTNIPGTTRDILEENLSIGGVPIKLTDTAGIRNTEDVVEKIGVDRAMKTAETADLVLLVLDSSEQLLSEEVKLLKFCSDKKTIVILNKTDLPQKIDSNMVSEFISEKYVVEISLKSGLGLGNLTQVIKNMFFGGEVSFGANTLTNVRHKILVEDALFSLKSAIATIEDALPEDFISIDLQAAYKKLGEILGEDLNEDFIDEMFARFCLGK